VSQPVRPQLQLGPGFFIDANIATRRGILLGQPDSGKTSALTRIAEELLKIRVPVCILDWKGDLWGIRSSADGTHDGFAVVIFGGDHGDIRIEPGDGHEIGRLVAIEELSALIDLSGFVSDAARRLFATTFLRAFLHAKRRALRPHTLLIDEYQQFAAERPGKAARADPELSAPSALLAATQTVVGLGRKRGIGVIGTAQRAAQLSKSVHEISDVYLFMQIAGRNDLATIVDTVKAAPDEAKLLLQVLPRLHVGEVYVYSPSWLRMFEKKRFGPRETFDSSRTPEVGVELSTYMPRSFAAIDIPALRERIAQTREDRELEDSDALRARVAQLEAELDQRAIAINETELAALRQRVEKLVSETQTKDAAIQFERERFRAIINLYAKNARELADLIGNDAATTDLQTVAAVVPASNNQQISAPPRRSERKAPDHELVGGQATGIDLPPVRKNLGPAANAILTALASLPTGSASRSRVAALAGYSARKSTFRNALSTLRAAALMTSTDDTLTLTQAGRNLAGPAPARKTTNETIAMWRAKIKGPAPLALLDILVETYPERLDRDALGRRAKVDPAKSTFRNALSALRVQGLLDEQDMLVGASADLFPTGKR
jgi:hypothetical protein